MTRQRMYQLRHRAMGLCVNCAEPAVNADHCEKHRLNKRRQLRARANCSPWKLGGPGRPPDEERDSGERRTA
jgi:hypothetical protein